MIRLEVIGVPQTQGSKQAFVVNGRAVVAEGKGAGRKRHKEWRAAVADAARQWCAEHGNPSLITEPVIVRLTFGLQRPASAPKRTRTFPIKARSGDVDKLQRSILDSLTGTLIADDSQVIGIVAAKDWSDPPGVVIELVLVDDASAAWDVEFYPARLPDGRAPFDLTTVGAQLDNMKEVTSA